MLCELKWSHRRPEDTTIAIVLAVEMLSVLSESFQRDHSQDWEERQYQGQPNTELVFYQAD